MDTLFRELPEARLRPQFRSRPAVTDTSPATPIWTRFSSPAGTGCAPAQSWRRLRTSTSRLRSRSFWEFGWPPQKGDRFQCSEEGDGSRCEVVRPVRFELTTSCSGGKRSIQTELRAQKQTKSAVHPGVYIKPVMSATLCSRAGGRRPILGSILACNHVPTRLQVLSEHRQLAPSPEHHNHALVQRAGAIFHSQD